MGRRAKLLFELKIVCVVIVVILAVAIPALRRARERSQDLACLRNIMALCEGPLPNDTACPVGGEQYYREIKEGVRSAFCPAKEPHLPSQPRFQRPEDGGRWSVSQTFPPPPSAEAGADLAAGWTRKATVTVLPDGAARVESAPSALANYVVAPALGLVTLACALLFLGTLGWSLHVVVSESRKRALAHLKDGAGLIVCSAVWVLMAAYGTAYQLREETVELRAGRAIYAAAPDTIVLVTVCVPSRSGDERLVVLLDRAKPSQARELFVIAPEQVGALTPLHQAIWPLPPTVRGWLGYLFPDRRGTRLTGWALDDAAPARRVAIRVYAGGQLVHTGLADGPRADVNEATGVPGEFGFDVQLGPEVKGPFVVCAVDSNRGEVRLPQGASVGTPMGVFEGIRDDVAYGWSLDPNAPAATLTIELYLAGTYGEAAPIATQLANLPARVVNHDLGLPGNHGFAVQIPPEARGRRVQVYAINVGAGRDRLLNPD